jgi:hypothetical protein
MSRCVIYLTNIKVKLRAKDERNFCKPFCYIDLFSCFIFIFGGLYLCDIRQQSSSLVPLL